MSSGGLIKPSDALYSGLVRNITLIDDRNDLVQRVGRGANNSAIYIARSQVVDVAAVLADVTKTSGGASDIVEIYADVVYASGPIVAPLSCRLISIWARVLFAGNTADSPVKLELKASPAVFRVYTGLSHQDVPIEITQSGKKQNSVLSFLSGAFSFSVRATTGQALQTTSPLPPAASKFEYMTILDQILNDGSITTVSEELSNDNLPKLLTFEMLAAEALQQSHPHIAYGMASFVMANTAGIPKALELNAQASAFLASQVVGNATNPQSLIPEVDLCVADQVLRSRLSAAAAFESAFQTFKAQGDVAENTQILANAALDNAEIASKAYAFLANEAEARYETSLRALNLAEQNFQQLQLEMPAKQEAFKDGIEAWKIKATLTTVAEALVAVAIMVGAIAATVVAPPAGAAALAASGTMIPVIKAAIESNKTVMALIRVIDRLKYLFAKMKGGLSKIGGIVSSIKSIMELMKKLKRVGRADDTMSTPVMQIDLGDDAINMAADWDVFDAEMDGAFGPIMDLHIRGAPEFHTLLKQMVVRAKAVLAAQLACTVASVAYATATVQALASEAQTANLRKAVARLQGNPQALRVFRANMFEQLVRVRVWVYLDLANYAAAYSWYAMDDRPPVSLDPMKPIGNFFLDASTIQSKAVQAATVLRPQRCTFMLSSVGGAAGRASGLALNNHAENWLEELRATRAVTLTVDPHHAQFQSYKRVRVIRFVVVLRGAVAPDDLITLKVTRGQTMLDLREPLPDGVADGENSELNRLVAVVGARHKLGVAYKPSKDGMAVERLLMSGELIATSLAGGVSSSLFADWKVDVAQSIDLGQVQGIDLEVECEVSLL